MKLTTFTTLLFATSVFAHPTLVRGLAKREVHPISTDSYAGLMVNAPANNSFVAVEADFIVPEVKIPGSSNGTTYGASFWVGLGMDKSFGLKGEGSVLKAGVKVTLNETAPTYNAFYEYLPDIKVTIPADRFDIRAGDTITAKVSPMNGTAGVLEYVKITNTRTKKVEEHLVKSNSTSTFPGSCADFVVEAPADGKLANFDTVKFAINELGSKGPMGSIKDLVQDAENYTIVAAGKDGKDSPVTNTEVLDGFNVQVKYTGA